MNTQWQTVIGLEIHAQLRTRSKIFSGAASAYGGQPNTRACAIDLGLPGVLPVLNEEAVRMAVKFGLATGSTVAKRCVFARKNYFYPDLPKGYQISQYELPIVHQGHLDITTDGQTKTIGITRAHLEEDAGKSVHEGLHDRTGIDLNRAGTPLLEIVSEPDLRSAAEAVAYMKKIHAIVRYLDMCDGNMQEGSFRCDANISVRPLGVETLGIRTELKNLNSFRFVEKAIDYEIQRHITVLEDGGEIAQETRLYDPASNETRSMRSKEEANDYRYFPDPDLLPVEISDNLIEEIRASLPELPEQKQARFIEQYSLGPADAELLTGSRELADFFEATVAAAGGESKACANWIQGDLLGALHRSDTDLAQCPLRPEHLAGLIRRIADGTISSKIAKQVFESMWAGAGDADTIIAERGLRQVTDTGAIDELVRSVIQQYPDQAAQYRSGKDKLLGFFVGQVMQASRGKANPAQVNAALKARLNED
ncbi:MAG: Asp-tRNA(Asn)/Glu-tRNA(Gln) amidotransferase GatCAB subunit B [Gammaproteobacteria bacterium]|nr:MAG: Asp-tRNA(Asn)/Glu-tRNA(Gln) amidotransferase GatCAB subunit B [Gammaproteobacteria bacterium]